MSMAGSISWADPPWLPMQPACRARVRVRHIGQSVARRAAPVARATRENHLRTVRRAVMVAPVFPARSLTKAMPPSAAPKTADALLPLELERAIDSAREALLAQQQADGQWVYELEADATIPAEYILLQHYLGEIDDAVQAALAQYLRQIQGEHGGWPLFHGGDFNISASVKAYFALKAAGDPPEAPHMMRARAAILRRGGAAQCNVFTRIQLALFGELPWTAVPVMPVEIMHLPRWFP